MLSKRKEYCRGPFRNKGSMLITLIITMLIFSVLAAALYSLTTSSIFSQLNTSSTTRAAYIAKSGYNYLASQYKHAANEAAKNLVLETMHNVNFQLSGNDGSFQLNVEPYYLRSQQALTITNTNGLHLNVKFPGAVSYTIPASGTMAVYTSAGYRRFLYSSYTTVSSNNYTLNLSDTNPPDGQPFTIGVGESIVPVLTLASNQTLSNGGNLTLTTGTGGILPARFGFFEIPRNANTSSYVFYYENRNGDIISGIRNAQDPSGGFTSRNLTTTDGMIYVHTSAQINSTGTFNGPSPAVSNTFSRMAILGYKPGGNSDDVPHNIPGVNDWIAFGAGTNGPGIAIDTANQLIMIGQGLNDTAGVAWYAGDSDSADCASGICTFGTGIRAYFEFRDTNGSGSSGDGFMFIIMNGTVNDTTKRGGTPSGSGMGELMGYAGPGNTLATSSPPLATPPLDGLGLEPPKISIEFDRYNNSGVSTPAGCINGRNDAAGNHMALILCGANTAGNCSNGLPAVSYDDNVHNAGIWGDDEIPRNSATGDSTADGSRGYYATSFANTNTRTFRTEITRAATANVNGNYEYNIKAWIDCTSCNDVSLPFSASTPQINRTIELTPTLHSYFHKMIFGVTQGTGAATQNIQISNFDIFFP